MHFIYYNMYVQQQLLHTQKKEEKKTMLIEV